MKLRFFEIAKAASKKSIHHKSQIGSVIVKRNKIIGIGINSMKTHPNSNLPWKTKHSELDAILDCRRKDLENADIYIYREDKRGKLACCKPCKYCQELLSIAKIRNVFYIDHNGTFVKLE